MSSSPGHSSKRIDTSHDLRLAAGAFARQARLDIVEKVNSACREDDADQTRTGVLDTSVELVQLDNFEDLITVAVSPFQVPDSRGKVAGLARQGPIFVPGSAELSVSWSVEEYLEVPERRVHHQDVRWWNDVSPVRIDT